jgi:lipoprotein NlpI
MNNYTSARIDLTQATKTPPNNETALDQIMIAQAYSSLGAIDWHEDAEEQALDQFNRSIALFDMDSDVYIARGSLLARRGSLDEALEDFNHAALLKPKDAVALRSKGYALFNSGKYQEAATAFGFALKRDPKDGYSAIMLYLIGRRTGGETRSKAERNVSSIDLSVWPGPVLGHLLGKTSESELVDLVARAAPNDRQGWDCEVAYYLGELAQLKGRSGEARRRFGHAVDVCPNEFDEVPGAKSALKRL